MYDDFQALLEQQKAIYLQQNSQLAKYNSGLMMKITDMETKVSELIQENVQLRSRLSMSELRYREKVNKIFNMLEDGVISRFSEVSQLFDRVRRNQGLEAGIHGHTALGLSPKSIMKRDSSRSPKSTKSVEFRGSEVESDVNVDNSEKPIFEDTIAEDNHENSSNSVELNQDEVRPLAKKRRKSSRRESLFIPADFEFNNENLEMELNDIVNRENEIANSHNNNEDTERKDVEMTETAVPAVVEAEAEAEAEALALSEAAEAAEAAETAVELAAVASTTSTTPSTTQSATDNNADEDESYNFTASVIEYSIPEEASTHDHSHILMDLSKSKIEVYNDKEEPSNGATGAEESTSFVQCAIPSQSKVKHSMKNPKTRLKGNQDDIMPQTEYDEGFDKRERRTRGKAVNYKLPSLRAKMRRPTEKFVDATTVTDIHDLQVQRAKNQHQQREHSSDIDEEKDRPISKSGSNEGFDPTNVMGGEKQVATPLEQKHDNNDNNNETNKSSTDVPPSGPNEKKKSSGVVPLHEVKIPQNVGVKTALKEKPANIMKRNTKDTTIGPIKEINQANERILKDVSPNKVLKKQPPDSDSKQQQVSDISGPDLTAFEIIDGISLKHVAKTHRVRAKEDMSRKRKRIHANEPSI